MSYRDNLNSVLSNFSQQTIGAIIALFIPVLLGIEEFGQVVFVGTLISFMPLSDLGISSLYNRRMPAIYARGDEEETLLWNATTFRLRMVGAVLFGIASGLIYWSKYHDSLNALLFLLWIALNTIVSFFIAYWVVQGRFTQSRDLTVLQSVTRLIMIPAVAVLGLLGWFFGQLAGTVLIFFSKDLRLMAAEYLRRHSSIDWKLVVSNLQEAFILSAISVLCLQLLSSARLYASFFYPDVMIAKYGLVNNVYQVALSLVVAAFIPQTIKVYKMYEADREGTVEYTFKSASVSMPFICAVSLICLFSAPLLLNLVYKKYQIENQLFAPVILSLFNLPIFSTFGTLLIASRRYRLCLVLLVGGGVLDWVIIKALEPHVHFQAAASAQMISLSIYSLMLIMAVYSCFHKLIKIRRTALLALLQPALAPIVLYILG